jgi:hypothetical protein
VDGTGSGSHPVAGSGISGVKPLGSATRVSYLLRWSLGKWVKRMRGEWNWLRIVCYYGLRY